MGNSEVSSKNDYGSIDLQYDSNVCIGDQDFKGKVVVNVIKEFMFQELIVRVVGVEGFKSSKGEDNKEKIIDHIPLDMPNDYGLVEPGEYRLSFTLKIPAALTNSFPKMSLGGIEGFVEYTCDAKLMSDDDKFIEVKKRLIVSQAPIYSGGYSVTKSQLIDGWFGSPKGLLNIDVVFPKDGIFSGENLPINVNLNNSDCTLDIKRVKCKLYEDTKLTSNKSNFTNSPMSRIKIKKWYLPGDRKSVV